MAGPRLQVLHRIVSGHAAPQLQAAWVGRQGAKGGCLGGLVGTQHDDVAPRQRILSVQLGKPGGGVLRLKVGLQLLLAAAAGKGRGGRRKRQRARIGCRKGSVDDSHRRECRSWLQ